MIKNYIKTLLILISATTCCSQVYAEMTSDNLFKNPITNFNKENLNLIKNNDITKDFLKIITYNPTDKSFDAETPIKIDFEQTYKNANEKFAQGNITAAYKDYKTIISQWANDDFVNLGLAYKFANMGLFSLSQEAINNITDRELFNNQIQLIKSKLTPQVILSYDEEIKLAQNYTEIYYHNLAFEVTRDMSKQQDKYKRSDYAQYILAQAYYNVKEYNKAINTINKALSINPDNLNYLKYKAQILSENNKTIEANKILDEILKENTTILDYKKDIESLRYYNLAKAEKDRTKSKFYIANYFYELGDKQRAIKELNQNISANKKDYKSITKLANIHFEENQLAEAMDLYEKSYKIKKNYKETLLGIAQMYLLKKDYKNAATFYLKALHKDKNNPEVLINIAYCYKMLNLNDKAFEYTNKAFKTENPSGYVYYIASKIDEIKEIQYLKKAISTDLLLVDAWLTLTDIALKNKRTDLAQQYLTAIKYINSQNYKYYYFLGLTNKQQGFTEKAKANFEKALELNPTFVDASNELNTQK